MMQPLTEKDLLISLKAAHALGAIHEILATMTDIAAQYNAQGLTQEGADILAFVLRNPYTPEDILEAAEDHWDDLASWICPRVLVDAEDFGSKATLDDVIEYIFA